MVRQVIKGVVIGLMLFVVVCCLAAMFEGPGPVDTGITFKGIVVLLGIIWVIVKILTRLTE